MIATALARTRLAIVVPHDMVLDHELWRWTPNDVSLHITRTRHTMSEVTMQMVAAISDARLVAAAVEDLSVTESAVFAYACTSGSFVRGVVGERDLVQAMRSAGAPAAVTTSGALVQALRTLDVERVAVATPYDEAITDSLAAFLREVGITVTATAQLGLTHHIWKQPYAATREFIRSADHPDAQAVVASCTNLPTYDLIAPLELELGKPVITANQATMWAALRTAGHRAVGPGQRLLDR